jgi:dUTP pyrophosphatase
MTKIQIKKLSPTAIIPKYETSGASGLDLAADIKTNISLKPGDQTLVSTGLAIAIPQGFEVQIRPRSGLAAKKRNNGFKYSWNDRCRLSRRNKNNFN